MKKEIIQEQQYSFPYHHLSYIENDAVFVFKHLFWGLIHITYIEEVIKKIQNLKPNSLLDVGCGEGRIIYELENRNFEAEMFGIDISSRAIQFANAFANKSNFKVYDIISNAYNLQVDLVLSCEVIEHIEPNKISDYIENISKSLKPGGHLIITTPTTNVPVNPKHYQHFDSKKFEEILKYKFKNITYEYLNKDNLLSKILSSIISNRIFISNSKTINKMVLKLYKRYCLFADNQSGGRVLVIAQKK